MTLSLDPDQIAKLLAVLEVARRADQEKMDYWRGDLQVDQTERRKRLGFIHWLLRILKEG